MRTPTVLLVTSIWLIVLVVSPEAPVTAQPSAPADADYPFEMDCTMTGVLDSDTIQLRCGLVTKTLRLRDIDGPEPGQPFGDEATSRLAKLSGTAFKVTVYNEQAGLWLGSARASGWDLGDELIRQGLAWTAPASKDPRTTGLESEARKRGLGLWSAGAPIAPWEWRRSHPRAAPALMEKALVIVTDDNLVKGDWAKFDAQGREAMAKWWEQESKRREAESTDDYKRRMRQELTEWCHRRYQDARLNFCMSYVMTKYATALP